MRLPKKGLKSNMPTDQERCFEKLGCLGLLIAKSRLMSVSVARSYIVDANNSRK